MNIPQLLKDRHCGFLKIAFSRTYGTDLQVVISQMGFDIRSAELTAIDAAQAAVALSRLFSRDLAYGVKVMDADVAQRYARELIAECAETDAKIFTNARWEGEKLFGCNPVSEATFDVLILIINNDFAVSVLIEDED